MTAEMKILIAWLLFAGTHIGGSSVPIRTRLIRALGLRGFKGLYTLVALVTFLTLGYVYFNNKHAGAALFDPGAGLRLLSQAIMLMAFVVVAQGIATPSPLSTKAEMAGAFPDRARGIQRITRHPQNLAFALFGLAHGLANPNVGDWISFGGFAVFAFLSAAHQDRRARAAGPDAVRQFQDQTSLLPFGAILSGRQRLAAREFSPIALGVSVVLFVVVRAFHGRMFGGFADLLHRPHAEEAVAAVALPHLIHGRAHVSLALPLTRPQRRYVPELGISDSNSCSRTCCSGPNASTLTIWCVSRSTRAVPNQSAGSTRPAGSGSNRRRIAGRPSALSSPSSAQR
jgi:uncharacterized membrane protein